jgi:6,7-dimethyl-8-ribityllumazine synthase
MAETIQGQLRAEGKNFGLVVSRFNEFITSKLLAGAIDAIVRHGGSEENITIVWVPGSWEIPVTAGHMAQSGRYDAVICLGAVIRGSTGHYDFVAAEVSKGVAKVGLDTGMPVVFGVLTCDTIEQAVERAGTKLGNSGFKAAETAMEMIDVVAQVSAKK